jgi:hypothetical protein
MEKRGGGAAVHEDIAAADEGAIGTHQERRHAITSPNSSRTTAVP